MGPTSRRSAGATKPTPPGRLLREAHRCPARATARGVALAACLVLPACGNRPDPAATADPATVAPPPAVARPKPPPPVPPPPEPGVVAARAEVIRRDATAIRAECQRAAGGDWDKWQRDTAPFRAALKAKVDALKTFDPPRAPWLDSRYEALEGRDGFPLFEVGAREHLRYLYDPAALDGFRRDRPVAAAHRWLHGQGVDLIFVPVPKMTEVYAEHFLDPCPPDGVVAPHVRRTLLELLDDGVEVVDGYRLFRPARRPDPEYLYNTADPHWAPKAMTLMAKEVARRVARYRFGAEARSAAPVVNAAPGKFFIPGSAAAEPHGDVTGQYGWPALGERQRERAAAAQTTVWTQVTLPDGRVPPDDRDSPVVLIGNSFAPQFRELLVKELNLLIRTRWRAAATTEVFADFLREPELLDGCRVVVWVVSDRHLPDFRPLPAEIAAEARPE